jgi:hypothetical protein
VTAVTANQEKTGDFQMKRLDISTAAMFALALHLFTAPAVVYAQETTASPPAGMAGMPGMAMGGPSATANDLFVMAGSDFDRPGLVPRANYSIGVGHMFDLFKKNPFGDEMTFSYMYENSGTHGFLHTDFGEHTESVGMMRNFHLPATKRLTGYTWIQTGITSFTGNAHVQNRMDSSLSVGAIVHLNRHSSIWIQESYGKVVTVPWFTTASVGYGWSW